MMYFCLTSDTYKAGKKSASGVVAGNGSGYLRQPKKKTWPAALLRYKLVLFMALLIVLMSSMALFDVQANMQDGHLPGGELMTGDQPVHAVHEQTVVEVARGDSLWSIASVYAPPGTDKRRYIEQVKQLNGLKSSMLGEGQVLLLP